MDPLAEQMWRHSRRLQSAMGDGPGGLQVKQVGSDSYEATERLKTVEIEGKRIGIYT